MHYTLQDRLLKRELGHRRRYCGIKGLYGDRQWLRDMDIVNELDGHSGCVNALSWSKSGKLLASGSDDQHVNIHSYQSEGNDSSFNLATSISTGHSANIFSVKFMPHSNDRTVISAAGDAEIRIFDIEYAGRAGLSSEPTSTRAQGFTSRGIQYLTQADTNCRVYRSHSDRVKRIVTESSPYLFLTCSEDGEVRQWDLRQPSAAYPRPTGGGRWRSRGDEPAGPVPPPLISYKKWNVSLNTISCSPSQPYYILLGGEHLCAFLHDRRMLGRDIDEETGATRASSTLSDHDDEAMGQATQCVKRFAPKQQRRIKSTDTGHITACKISDANPNEAVVSWSGDWIYSFNMLQTPDAREEREQKAHDERRRSRANKLKQARERKRKRQGNNQSPGLEEGLERGSSRTRTEDEDGDLALRVRYQNGQTEDIPVRQNGHPEQGSERDQSSSLVGAQRSTHADRAANTRSLSLALQVVSLREFVFDVNHESENAEQTTAVPGSNYSAALCLAVPALEEMYDISRTWSYPITPDELEVVYQNTLRSDRESAMRFVQAAGTLSRLLGGNLPMERQDHLFRFAHVRPAPHERPIQRERELFSYDFLKAIILWLSSGPGALVEVFSRELNRSVFGHRLPCPPGSGIDAIDEHLIPYLMNLADDTISIYNIEVSKFEVDENRIVFLSEKDAVQAFAEAVRTPFDDIVSLNGPHEDADSTFQSRSTALDFWGRTIGRSVLLTAGSYVDHAFVDKAFGGNGTTPRDIRQRENNLRRRFENINTEEDDLEIESIGLRRNDNQSESEDEEIIALDDVREAMLDAQDAMDTNEQEDSDDSGPQPETNATIYQNMLHAMIDSNGAADNEDEDEDEDDDDNDYDNDDNDSNDDDEDSSSSSSSPASDSEDESTSRPRLFTSRAERRAAHSLHASTQIIGPTRTFIGHCNVKTVKDVNFFGLDDDYIVSGSDSGHVFIWDRHTSQLVNILEGDGEVVNVVQGHPYEPLLAVSGIDSTVKVFGVDKRARRDARRGIGVRGVDEGGFSSLRFGGRRMRMAAMTATAGAESGEQEVVDSDETDTEPSHAFDGLSSRKRMAQEYEITSRNDHDRRGGNRDAFITRGVLARLAQQIVARRAAGGGVEEGGEGMQNLGIMTEDGELVVDTGDCEVM